MVRWSLRSTWASTYIYKSENRLLTSTGATVSIPGNYELLNYSDGIMLVKKGESYFIPSGTIHAICSGCLICEIQQNSNITYRVYDYGRKDKNGNEITYVHPNNETYILSNEVPITQEIFKYFVGWDLDSLKNRQKIDDMKITNYTLVNKIVNEIVQLERPDKSKSNIIQPVFFRSVDSEFITIHPSVTENICINLDSYKHLVDSFLLQIEGVKFAEIGRLKAGVVFKVFGNRLPKKISSGQYYILNQDSEVVTSGKYIYEV
jgi:hypothetical protein